MHLGCSPAWSQQHSASKRLERRAQSPFSALVSCLKLHCMLEAPGVISYLSFKWLSRKSVTTTNSYSSLFAVPCACHFGFFLFPSLTMAVASWRWELQPLLNACWIFPSCRDQGSIYLLGEARPRPCRVQRVIMHFRLDLWLFWFSDYKEMSVLARQELVKQPAMVGGNRGTQIASISMFFFDGKDIFLVTL